MSRRDLGELDYPLEVGIHGDAGFRAQRVRLSGALKRGGFVAVSNEAWPDSDIPSRFAVAEISLVAYTRPRDPSSLHAEVALYAASEHESVRDAAARVRSARDEGGADRVTATGGEAIGGRERAAAGADAAVVTIGGFTLTGSADESIAMQRATDERVATWRTPAPGMLGDEHAGDVAGAVWARDVESGESFPVTISAAVASLAPLVVRLDGRGQYLTDALTWNDTTATGIAAPPASPIRLRAYPLAQGEDRRAVTDRISSGERSGSRSLEFGSRTDILQGDDQS